MQVAQRTARTGEFVVLLIAWNQCRFANRPTPLQSQNPVEKATEWIVRLSDRIVSAVSREPPLTSVLVLKKSSHCSLNRIQRQFEQWAPARRTAAHVLGYHRTSESRALRGGCDENPPFVPGFKPGTANRFQLCPSVHRIAAWFSTCPSRARPVLRGVRHRGSTAFEAGFNQRMVVH